MNSNYINKNPFFYRFQENRKPEQIWYLFYYIFIVVFVLFKLCQIHKPEKCRPLSAIVERHTHKHTPTKKVAV